MQCRNPVNIEFNVKYQRFYQGLEDGSGMKLLPGPPRDYKLPEDMAFILCWGMGVSILQYKKRGL